MPWSQPVPGFGSLVSFCGPFSESPGWKGTCARRRRRPAGSAAPPCYGEFDHARRQSGREHSVSKPSMTPDPKGRTFSMTSEAEHLLRLRKWLREELAGHGVPKHDQPNLLLAVGELCANSIQHAYQGRAGQPITVSVRSSDDSVVIEVEDFGKPFDADRYESPNLEAVPESGY